MQTPAVAVTGDKIEHELVPGGTAPPTVQLASLPRQWRAEADATDRGLPSAPDDHACATALRDCAQELDEILSISPRGCWEHPGVMGYQHPDCGFCWHGKDGLDVPTSGEGANRGPTCPRCELSRVQSAARTLGKVITRLAESMEAARIEMIQNGPEAAMQWILNSLPDVSDEAPEDQWDGKETATQWIDRTQAADRAAEAAVKS